MSEDVANALSDIASALKTGEHQSTISGSIGEVTEYVGQIAEGVSAQAAATDRLAAAMEKIAVALTYMATNGEVTEIILPATVPTTERK